MSLLRARSASAPTQPLAATLFIALLRRIRHGHLTLVTPEGEQMLFGSPCDAPAASLRIHDWQACRAILRSGDIGFGDAYRAGWIEAADWVALVRLALCNQDTVALTIDGGRLAQLWYALRHRLRANSRAGSRRNIHAHYDIGNAFYALWLDQTWTYSSACFDGDPARSLEEAQAAKYQRIVDTLGLRAGMRALELGCGWGGFAEYAARLGIHVDALTISQEQHRFAVRRIAQAGLAERARILLRDYRHASGDANGGYDAIVSIEMFEAVGEAFWPTYFRTVERCLKPGARALIQSITIDDARFNAYRASSDFIRETIFPGGMLPSPARFIAAARRSGLAAQAVFAFGHDYARTLRAWSEAFEAQLDAVRAQGFDEKFVRTWRLYLAYCEAAFLERRTDVVHFVVTRDL